MLPSGEDLNEWLALNTVDFFNEMSLLYGVVADSAAEKFRGPGEGFPDGFEYRWADTEHRRPIRCSASDYVEYVMTWVEGMLQNERIFPSRESEPFPSNFTTHVKSIFKRLFRVFAIMYVMFERSVRARSARMLPLTNQRSNTNALEHRYTNHVKEMKEMEADKHLNTCFKHFIYFASEFRLVNSVEFAALKEPTAQFQNEFKKSKRSS